ncbi:MAG TPA: hypothetical protein VIH45_08330 [Desulfuromonadaceae bacterium]
MADKVRLNIPPAIAAFVRPGGSADEKLKGLATAATLAPGDRVLLLICLMQDGDSVVKGAAGAAFEALPPDVVVEFIRSRPETHPAILDVIARVHHAALAVAGALLDSASLSPQARAFLLKGAMGRGTPAEPSPVDSLDNGEEPGEGPEGDAEEQVDEESEEFLSKYKLAQTMGIADKIKTALTGDKEWRTLLIKDSNKLVSGSVIKNPRITESEILAVVKSGVQNDEIMRLICANKEWVKNIKIRKALVENPRTPVPNALRFLSTLGEKDIAAYAKSKNISSVISTQARRILMNKKRS